MRLASFRRVLSTLTIASGIVYFFSLTHSALAAPEYSYFQTRMEFAYSGEQESHYFYVLASNPILTANTNLLPQAHSRLRLHKDNGDIIETPWVIDNYVGPKAADHLPAGTPDANYRQCGEIKNSLGHTEAIIKKVEVQIKYTPNSGDPDAFEFIDWMATQTYLPPHSLDDLGNLVQSNTAREITFEYCHLDSSNQIITNANSEHYLFRGRSHPKSTGLQVKTLGGTPALGLLAYLNPTLTNNQVGSKKLQLSLVSDDQRQVTLEPDSYYDIHNNSVSLFCSGYFIENNSQLSSSERITALDFNHDGNCGSDDLPLFAQEFRAVNQTLFESLKAGDRLIITEHRFKGSGDHIDEVNSRFHSAYTLAKDYDLSEPDALYLTTPLETLYNSKVYTARIVKGQDAELTIQAPKAGISEGSFGFGNLAKLTCPTVNSHYTAWELKDMNCLYHGTSTGDPLTFKAQIDSNQYFTYEGVDLLISPKAQTFIYDKSQQKLNLKKQITDINPPFVYGYHTNEQGEIVNYFGKASTSKGSGTSIAVQAQVLPYLKMTIAGLPAGEQACKKASGNDPVVSDVATTGYNVPMGILNPQNFTQAAQQITIATNAHYGYVLTARALRNFHLSADNYASCEQDNCIAMITTPENNEGGVLWNNQESGFGYTMYLVSGDTYLNQASYSSSPIFQPGGSQPGNNTPSPEGTIPNASLHFNYLLDGHWQGFALEKSAQLLNNNRSSSSDVLNICYRIKPSAANRAGKYHAKIVYTATATF